MPLFYIYERKTDMGDELIKANEIYLQDVVCDVVQNHPTADDVAIYNIVCTMVDVPALQTVKKIIDLIRINKITLNTD